MACRRTSTRATWAASGASPKPSSTGSSASTPGWCRPRSRPSAASRSRASGARDPSMGSTSGSRPSTCAWEACDLIVEERTYHVFTGKLPEVVRMYTEEGTAIQQEHLGNLVGAYTVDVGDVSSIVHLWGYESFADREQRRPKLQADPRWADFLARLQPLIHTH